MQLLCTLLGCQGEKISTTCRWASGSKLRLELLNELWDNKGGQHAFTLRFDLVFFTFPENVFFGLSLGHPYN